MSSFKTLIVSTWSLGLYATNVRFKSFSSEGFINYRREPFKLNMQGTCIPSTLGYRHYFSGRLKFSCWQFLPARSTLSPKSFCLSPYPKTMINDDPYKAGLCKTLDSFFLLASRLWPRPILSELGIRIQGVCLGLCMSCTRPCAGQFEFMMKEHLMLESPLVGYGWMLTYCLSLVSNG